MILEKHNKKLFYFKYFCLIIFLLNLPVWFVRLLLFRDLSTFIGFGRRLIPLFVFGISFYEDLIKIFSVLSVLMNSFFFFYFTYNLIFIGNRFILNSSSWWFNIALQYSLYYFLVYFLIYFKTKNLGLALNFSIQSVSALAFLWEYPIWRSWNMIFHFSHPFFSLNTQILSIILLSIILIKNKFSFGKTQLIGLSSYLFFSLLFFAGLKVHMVLYRIPAMGLMAALSYSLNNPGGSLE